MAARYSIGIDLGTTNSALAFASLVGDARPEILLIPQWESVTRLADDPTLRSFFYLPEEVAAAQGRRIAGKMEQSGRGRAARPVVFAGKLHNMV